MLQTGIKWFQELLCYLTGTKWTLVPAQKQPVLIERGRIALFLVVDRCTLFFVQGQMHRKW